MNCPSCNNPSKLFGKDRKGQQRYRCLSCGKTFGEPKVKMLDHMILAEGKALAVLSHLSKVAPFVQPKDSQAFTETRS